MSPTTRTRRRRSSTATRMDQVADFDHGRVARMPEYVALSRALRMFVEAVVRQDDREQDDVARLTVAGLVDLLADVALSLPYSDGCTGAAFFDHDSDMQSAIHVPFALQDDGTGWVTGRYWCPEHRTTWMCGWSVCAMGRLNGVAW